MLVLAFLGVVFSACAGTEFASQPAPFLNQPAATPTPLAVERSASTEPGATPKATAKSTPKTGSYYKPPGWDGHSDVNCKDFDTHAHADSFFKGTGGSPSNDPYGLDGDHDGSACETLP